MNLKQFGGFLKFLDGIEIKEVNYIPEFSIVDKSGNYLEFLRNDNGIAKTEQYKEKLNNQSRFDHIESSIGCYILSDNSEPQYFCEEKYFDTFNDVFRYILHLSDGRSAWDECPSLFNRMVNNSIVQEGCSIAHFEGLSFSKDDVCQFNKIEGECKIKIDFEFILTDKLEKLVIYHKTNFDTRIPVIEIARNAEMIANDNDPTINIHGEYTDEDMNFLQMYVNKFYGYDPVFLTAPTDEGIKMSFLKGKNKLLEVK